MYGGMFVHASNPKILSEKSISMIENSHFRWVMEIIWNAMSIIHWVDTVHASCFRRFEFCHQCCWTPCFPHCQSISAIVSTIDISSWINGAEFGPVHFKWIAHILMYYKLNPSIRICTSEWRGWNADYDICFEISWLWVFQSFKRTISKEIFYGRIAIKIIICNNQQEKRCNEIFHVFKHKWIAKHINMLKLNMECISSHFQFNGLRKNVPAQLDLVQQLNCICYTLTFMENGLNSCFANYNVSVFRSANSRRVVSKKSPNFFFSVEMGLKIIFCYFFIIFTLFQNFISSINVFLPIWCYLYTFEVCFLFSK